MIISSYTAKHGDKIYNILSKHDHIKQKTRQKTPKQENHVIVVGYDTQGKRIIETLEQEQTDYIVIDNNQEKITELKEKNQKYIFGDIMDEETWQKADYKNAKLIISTVPIQKTSRNILSLKTDADKILRAQTIEQAKKLLKQGAIYVNIPEILSSELLLDHIEGIMKNKQYKEEIRRKNMLEVRRYIQNQEG